VQTATPNADARGRARARLIHPLWLAATLLGVMLALAALIDTLDVASYHCYALAFWGGERAVAALPAGSCLVPLTSLASTPFHTLPVEYGPLALLAFLPPLALPMGWYDSGFFIEMALVIGVIALLLDRYGAPWAGYLWLGYVLVGDLVPAAGRFDALPAACVVVAVIAARRGRLRWAWVALALGTLLKLYPVALAPLLLIESWRARDREPFWRGPALFAALVAGGEALAALVAGNGALAPLTFMSGRCAQIESLPATLAWLWAQVTGAPISFPYSYTYNTTCEATASMGATQAIALALGLLAVAATLALYWRRRLSLGVAALLVIAAIILGSKVFSPQYLLWLSPLVALEYGMDLAAVLGWSAVCLITTLCFPLSYGGATEAVTHLPADVLVPMTAAARNLLMVGLVVALLWRARGDSAHAPVAKGGAS
ncbi:MAG TPA: hypothetical protein VF725_15225, partial [Ktedonobacterales bacterium]